MDSNGLGICIEAVLRATLDLWRSPALDGSRSVLTEPDGTAAAPLNKRPAYPLH
jgi:hypothetical protein